MFCIYLRTNSDLCHLQHKLIGFYNPDEKCLLRGTDWVFKYSGLRFVFKGLTKQNLSSKSHKLSETRGKTRVVRNYNNHSHFHYVFLLDIIVIKKKSSVQSRVHFYLRSELPKQTSNLQCFGPQSGKYLIFHILSTSYKVWGCVLCGGVYV